MDNEAAGKGTGTVQDPGAAGGGAAGGAGGGGEPPKPGAESGAGGQGKEFDRSKLHPALRDMQPEEITDLFETMATSLRTVQQPARREPDFSGVPEHARGAPPPPPPKEQELSREVLKEMFDPSSEKFDPEKAMITLAAKNYGHLFGDINLRTIRGLFGTFRTELPDFKDFEQEIQESISQSGRDPATLTEKDVLTTYFFVKGRKQTLKERQEGKSRAATTLAPTPAAEKPKQAELTEVEENVARRMFRKAKDPIAEYKKFAGYDEGITVRVPIGGGKVE